jgi:acyl-[acyl-carrier-protein] desaturase
VFFTNLLRHCLELDEAQTLRAVATQAAAAQTPGADILAYADKRAVVADAGIFGPDQLRQVVADEIAALGLSERTELADFVNI